MRRPVTVAVIIGALTVLAAIPAGKALQGAVPDLPAQVAAVDPADHPELKMNGISFVPVAEPTKLSEQDAILRAKEILNGMLVQEPSKVSAQLVRYTENVPGSNQPYAENRLVWKVVLVGAGMRLEGPLEDGREPEQPTSSRAITWILIDPQSGEHIRSGSYGPLHD